MYHSMGNDEREPMLAGVSPTLGKHPDSASSVRSMRLEAPSSKCNDTIFAVLFLVQLGVISVFAFWKGIPAINDYVKKNEKEPRPEKDFHMIFALGAGLIATGLVLAIVWIRILMAYAERMIRIALWLNVVLVLLFAVSMFAVNPFASLLFLVLAAVNVCYIYSVQDRIGFATANLKTACAAIKEYQGIFGIAVVLSTFQFAWLLLWGVASIGVYDMFRHSDPQCNQDTFNPHHLCGGGAAGVTFFFLLVSVYWGQQVMQNILTCTTSGVVASWWYHSNPQNVSLGSLYRSMTTSFGSICFGSLLVAILQALRTLARMLREQAQEDNNIAMACISCLAECILGCLESIMTYINQWAYVYVGIYGYDFRTSGLAVMSLFSNRGWTAVINDDLTSGALAFGSLGVGVVVCCVGLIAASVAPVEWFDALGSKQSALVVMGIVGFISGLSMAALMGSVIISAIHTVFVCFAEDPVSFSRNRPREYHDLVSGWRQFHNDALISAYGNAV